MYFQFWLGDYHTSFSLSIVTSLCCCICTVWSVVVLWCHRNYCDIIIIIIIIILYRLSGNWMWGTGIRGLMRGMATLPQGNQELLVVRDKVGRPPGELGVSNSMECDIFPFSALTLLVGWHEGHPACKKLDVGLLVVIWLELCTTYSSISPVVTSTSIILCFNKHRLTQVHLENSRWELVTEWESEWVHEQGLLFPQHVISHFRNEFCGSMESH